MRNDYAGGDRNLNTIRKQRNSTNYGCISHHLVIELSILKPIQHSSFCVELTKLSESTLRYYIVHRESAQFSQQEVTE